MKVHINEHSGSAYQPRCAVFLRNVPQEAIALALAKRWQKPPACPEFGCPGLVSVPKGI